MIRNFLKSILHSNKVITICIIACLVVGNFVILYEYSFVKQIVYMNGDYEYSVTTNDSLENVLIKTDKLNKSFKDITYHIGNGLVAVSNIKDVAISSGRRPKTDGEALSCLRDIPIGATIQYGDSNYTIVGKAMNSVGEVILPLSALDGSQTIAEVTMWASTMSQKKAYNALLQVFSESSITPPVKINFAKSVSNNPIFILVILMILLVVSTYAICMSFLFSKLHKPYTVYIFLGYSPDYIIAKLLTAVFGFVAVIFTVSASIFAIFDFVSMRANLSIYPVMLSFFDYVVVLAIFVILSIPLFIPVVRDLLKKSVGYKYV